MLKVIFHLFVTVLISNFANAADFVVAAKDERLLIGLNGSIVKGDAEKFEQLLKTSSTTISTELFVSSRGGDVAEAMKIGAILRDKNISVTVPPSGKCYSSCVFVLAAGNLKTVDGEVGIHRPYIVDVNASSSAIANEYPKILKAVKDFLEENGVTPSLADDMFSISPENIKILTKNEISRYRLDQQNYIKAEQSDIWWSKKLGISRAEFLQRKKQVDNECTKFRGDDDRMKICFNEIVYKAK